MKFKVVYNTWWMRKRFGMVFFFWMFFEHGKSEVTDRHFRHELQHCYQVKNKGRLWFYLTYAFYWFRYGMFWGGYKNNPYEVEAREHEYKPLTPQERSWKDRGVINL